MSDGPIWTGWLTPPDKKTGIVHAEIHDVWGWTIPLTGTWDEATGRYLLTGLVPEAPEGLRLPMVDRGKS